MTELFAIRQKRFFSAVYHETDDNGRPACRMGHQEIDYRTYPREELPDGAVKCSYCSSDTPAEGGDGSDLAQKLEEFDTVEEVLAN